MESHAYQVKPAASAGCAISIPQRADSTSQSMILRIVCFQLTGPAHRDWTRGDIGDEVQQRDRVQHYRRARQREGQL